MSSLSFYEIRYLAHPDVKLMVYDKETEERNSFHFPSLQHMYSSSTLSGPVLYCLVKLHISTLSSSWVYFFPSLPSSCFTVLFYVWHPNQFNSRSKYFSCTCTCFDKMFLPWEGSATFPQNCERRFYYVELHGVFLLNISDTTSVNKNLFLQD